MLKTLLKGRTFVFLIKLSNPPTLTK